MAHDSEVQAAAAEFRRTPHGWSITLPTAVVTAVLTALISRWTAPALEPPSWPSQSDWRALQADLEAIKADLRVVRAQVSTDVSSERTIRSSEVTSLDRRLEALERRHQRPGLSH